MTAESFFGIDVGDLDRAGAAAPDEIVRVFEILKPKAAETPLIRIGSDIDGSYLVPDDLDGITACFSPGVNRIKYFEDYLADRYGIASHMCDFTCEVDQFTTPLKPGLQTFQKKWLDAEPGPDNLSLEDWIRSCDTGGDLLLQMDIEGAEYRNLIATSPETLARFRMIVLEVHRLGAMLHEPVMRRAIAPCFAKLARDFTAVHVHPNNCCGEFEVPGSDIRIPNTLELTLLRNDRFKPAPGPPALPHPLDISRNQLQRPPLFLAEAWCDYMRPVESRVKILEDTQRYRDEVNSGTTAELNSALALLMLSQQTSNRLAAPAPQASRGLVEVAAGRPYRLSSAHVSSSITGIVRPATSHFFHTGFGRDQSIRVDLGRRYAIRRIEVVNRRGGYQDRLRFVFAVLSDNKPENEDSVFPMYRHGDLPNGAWQECGIDVPDVLARYVTITSPLHTALHFSDLKIYARAGQPRSAEPPATPPARRALRAAGRWLGRIRGRKRLRPPGQGPV